jgi:hypothetical protein
MKITKLPVLLALTLMSSVAFAQRDAANLPLVELPAFPKDADLILQPVDPRDTVKVYVDRSSPVVDEKETRVVYVVEAPSGIRNVFLEGLRCEGRLYSTYAIGGGDGSWRRIEAPAWQMAAHLKTNNPRAVLLDDGYLCGPFRNQLPAREVVRRLGRIIDTAPP